MQPNAHCHITIKSSQKYLLEDFIGYFDYLRREPDHCTVDSAEHGRIEIRNIWVTTALNGYLDFPHVGLAFMVERITFHKKIAKQTREVAYGITSKVLHTARAAQRRPENA